MADWKAELTERLNNLRIAPEREAEIIDELAQHRNIHLFSVSSV
jgi:hypothetical protein